MKGPCGERHEPTAERFCYLYIRAYQEFPKHFAAVRLATRADYIKQIEKIEDANSGIFRFQRCA